MFIFWRTLGRILAIGEVVSREELGQLATGLVVELFVKSFECGVLDGAFRAVGQLKSQGLAPKKTAARIVYDAWDVITQGIDIVTQTKFQRTSSPQSLTANDGKSPSDEERAQTFDCRRLGCGSRYLRGIPPTAPSDEAEAN